MASKRRLSLDLLLVSDSDSDTEAERKFVKEIQTKIDNRIRSEEAKKCKIDESHEANSPSDVAYLTPIVPKACVSQAVVVKAEVHSNQHASEKSSDDNFCEVVKVVSAVGPQKSGGQVSNLVPAREEVVRSEGVVVIDQVQDEDVIVISSDEDSKSDDGNLDDSFSPNQEGSRRVQTLMYEQEMGKFVRRNMSE